MTTATQIKKAPSNTVIINAEMYAAVRETKKGHIRVDLMLRLPGLSPAGAVRLCHRTFHAYGRPGFRSNDKQRWDEAEAWANARLQSLTNGLRRQTFYVTGAQN